MSNFFIILLLIIEFIKNYENNENIDVKLYNNSNNTGSKNPLIIELDKAMDLNHTGKNLNISNITNNDFFAQESIFFYYNFDPDPPPKFTTFTIFFRSNSKNNSLVSNIFDIKCLYLDAGNNLSDISTVNYLKNISISESLCYGSFDIKNKSKYKGIIYNEKYKYNYQSFKKIVFMIKYDWDSLTEIEIFLRKNIYNLNNQEGIIKENEEYTLIPYYINLTSFRNISNEIVLYSPRNNLYLYYLNDDIFNGSLLYKGKIISLFTDLGNIFLKYDNNEEIVLFTHPLFDNTNNNSIEILENNETDSSIFFEIVFSLEKIKIVNYYYFTKFPNEQQLSLQIIEQKEKCCFIMNYQKDEVEEKKGNGIDNYNIINTKNKKLYIELIYGHINSINIYHINNNSDTWEKFITSENRQNLTNNDVSYIENDNNQKDNYINMICAENNNIPSMIHFYYTEKESHQNPNISLSSSLIELSPGNTYVTNIENGSLLNITITNFDNESNILDFTLHAFNNENKINLEMSIDNDIFVTDKNIIKGFKIKIKNETKKKIILYNKANYSCNIIINIGLEINENDEIEIKNNKEIIYNKKYDIYYFKLPMLFQEYKYSKLFVDVKSSNKYFISDSINSIVYPNCDNLYLNNSFYEIINPYVVESEFFKNDNLNYYIIIKSKRENENINIEISYEKYDFSIEAKINSVFILKLPEKDKIINKTGIIIPYQNRTKSFIQMLSCNNNNLVTFEIYDNIYKRNLINDKLVIEQYHYYNIEQNKVDLSLSFMTEEKENNIFINYFAQSQVFNEKINNKFVIEFNNITNSISLVKPLNTSFNYTIFLDKKGSLSGKNINLCDIYTFNGLNDIAYYIKNISEEDFIDNQYKLNFTSDILKDYKSFDILIYAKEFPFGMHFLSNVISNEYIEQAILINKIFNKNENILYYIGTMESFNYYKIDTKGYYETIITIHFSSDLDINKINIDCAQIQSNAVKDIKIAMIEQKNREICKIFDIKNENNNNILNVFVKMVKNLYDSLAIRILNDNNNENNDIAIYMDIDNLNIKKEIIIDNEEENKIININHPFCFKYYKLYLDDINNNKYNQIGLYSKVKNSISLLVNDDINEKILIDYGNFIIINTNDDYIMNNYYHNKELIVIIGDNTKQILNINDMEVEPMKLNVIGLTKKNGDDEKINKINIIEYYTFNDIINFNDIFVPLYINKCDKNLSNFIVLNFKLNKNGNYINKKYIKISLDFGDIPLIEYTDELNKESFNDVIDNLISINLKEKNLIMFKNNLYIFKIVCTNYIYMNINVYEIKNEIKQDNYILKSGSSLDISLDSQDIINLDLNELNDTNLTKIELSNELINFDVDAEIDKNQIINMNTNNRILLLKLDKKGIKNIKIKANNKSGYIKILTNINNNQLIKEENNNYLSFNNKELYIYSHKIEPNNDLIKISIPILNKDKSNYISVCYYLSQIIFKNKNIPNCIKISENSFENITIRNPYNIYENTLNNISDLYVIFYKDGKNIDNKLELKEVIIEDEGKNSSKKDNEKKIENSSTQVGRFVLILFIIIIIFFIIFLLLIYIKKLNIKKKEMNYQTTINNENELLAQENNIPLNGNIFSLNA